MMLKRNILDSFFTLEEEVLAPKDIKKSRSGRHVVPPLAHWRNQNKRCDSQGNFVGIIEGPQGSLQLKVNSPQKPRMQLEHKTRITSPAQLGLKKQASVAKLCDPMAKISIEFLPPEMILHIFSFLDFRSLCKASTVNKEWNNLASDPILWEFLYHERWWSPRCESETRTMGVQDWKLQYMDRCQAEALQLLESNRKCTFFGQELPSPVRIGASSNSKRKRESRGFHGSKKSKKRDSWNEQEVNHFLSLQKAYFDNLDNETLTVEAF